MEKTYQLEQPEAAYLQQLDQERTQALAAVGALSLDMETARKNLDSVAERQRAFLQQALASRSVGKFENARMQDGALVVKLPDPPVVAEAPLAEPRRHVNGPAANIPPKE